MPVPEFIQRYIKCPGLHKFNSQHNKTLAEEKISVLKGIGRYIAVTWYGEMTLPEQVSPSPGADNNNPVCLPSRVSLPPPPPGSPFTPLLLCGLVVARVHGRVKSPPIHVWQDSRSWWTHLMCNAVHCHMSPTVWVNGRTLRWLSVFVLTEYCL